MRTRRNPALRVKVARRYYTFGQLLKKNLKKSLRRYKGKKRGLRAMKKAQALTRRQFKRGTIYHAGVKLKIVGWGGRIGAGGKKRRSGRRVRSSISSYF